MEPIRYAYTYGIRGATLGAVAERLRSAFDARYKEGNTGSSGGPYFSWFGGKEKLEVTIFNHFEPHPMGNNKFHPEWREFPILFEYYGEVPLDEEQFLTRLKGFDVTLLERGTVDRARGGWNCSYYYNEAALRE